MRFVAVDIETTGLEPGKHGIVEFGAVFADLAGTFEPKTLHLQVHPEDMVWSSYCLNLHRDLITEILAAKPEDHEPRVLPNPLLIGMHLRAWLISVCEHTKPNGDFEKVTGAGKNFGSFDLQFLLKSGGCNGIFRHRNLDPTPYYLKPEDTVPPELKLCKERAGLEPRVAHRALADAWDVVDLLQGKFRQT
jgi:hypothetical protein